ncbi:hypothetical protein DDZ13_03965 [Coraliomargarita sinensis]|uniref:Alpha-L-fucosidase C-terminal domain-containing protein n=1 Tax=Coraliomargarita sinensis TaxID=2174842 RepID=A0A317ZLS7_9BACT|nr:alpha-L-fucosidase C-terminal domain-containing protein [Coraliomargarita sinensis]PXA05127.1 hypothetical protein DDZ13_03965 [Coraliomargarita sinensis]
MEVNSESIHGSGPSPYEMPDWGRYTTKPGKLYAHVFHWPKSGKLTIADPAMQVQKVYLLADARKTPLQTTKTQDGWTITLPETTPDAAATVIAIEADK